MTCWWTLTEFHCLSRRAFLWKLRRRSRKKRIHSFIRQLEITRFNRSEVKSGTHTHTSFLFFFNLLLLDICAYQINFDVMNSLDAFFSHLQSVHLTCTHSPQREISKSHKNGATNGSSSKEKKKWHGTTEPNSGIPGKMILARRITLILWDLDSILHRVDVMPSELWSVVSSVVL